MVPTLDVVEHVRDKGGPPEYVERNGPLLISAAEALVAIAAEQVKK
jgi:hypothetical protein